MKVLALDASMRCRPRSRLQVDIIICGGDLFDRFNEVPAAKPAAAFLMIYGVPKKNRFNEVPAAKPAAGSYRY